MTSKQFKKTNADAVDNTMSLLLDAAVIEQLISRTFYILYSASTFPRLTGAFQTCLGIAHHCG
jgi:hypothetical protein